MVYLVLCSTVHHDNLFRRCDVGKKMKAAVIVKELFEMSQREKIWTLAHGIDQSVRQAHKRNRRSARRLLLPFSCFNILFGFFLLFLRPDPPAKANRHDTTDADLEGLEDDCGNLHLRLIHRIDVDVHD
jgi:hypothetical protein